MCERAGYFVSITTFVFFLCSLTLLAPRPLQKVDTPEVIQRAEAIARALGAGDALGAVVEAVQVEQQQQQQQQQQAAADKDGGAQGMPRRVGPGRSEARI